jgi:pSer/pThr/pTyr-binding forkhead associated (FHA) protein
LVIGRSNAIRAVVKPERADKEHRVADKDKGDEVTGDATSALTRADLVNALDAEPTVGPDGGAPVVEGLPAGSALLVVKRGPNAGSRFLLDRPVTAAGRHPGSDVFLDDITVSRRHAEFRREDDELHVVDVGSLNGTYVNRQPVEAAALVSGDEIQIGKFRLVFVRPSNDDGAKSDEPPTET